MHLRREGRHLPLEGFEGANMANEQFSGSKTPKIDAIKKYLNEHGVKFVEGSDDTILIPYGMKNTNLVATIYVTAAGGTQFLVNGRYYVELEEELEGGVHANKVWQAKNDAEFMRATEFVTELFDGPIMHYSIDFAHKTVGCEATIIECLWNEMMGHYKNFDIAIETSLDLVRLPLVISGQCFDAVLHGADVSKEVERARRLIEEEEKKAIADKIIRRLKDENGGE